MRTRLWIGSVALLTTLAWMAPAAANAQARQRYPYETGQSNRIGYDNGYRSGLANGERDARSRQPFDYQRDRDYQRADSGYHGGNRDAYRVAFRQGYAEGYRAGYTRYDRAGTYGTWRTPMPGYPGGAYPGQYPGTYSRGGFAFDRGYRDGFEEGQKASRGNDRYDPYREKDYRKGDNGYDKRYGSKDMYKQTYRNGFIEGYESGYREFQSGYRRPGWGW